MVLSNNSNFNYFSISSKRLEFIFSGLERSVSHALKALCDTSVARGRESLRTLSAGYLIFQSPATDNTEKEKDKRCYNSKELTWVCDLLLRESLHDAEVYGGGSVCHIQINFEFSMREVYCSSWNVLNVVNKFYTVDQDLHITGKVDALGHGLLQI